MKKKSELALISEKFDKNLDMQKANEFIKKYLPFAIYSCASKYKVYDRHIVLSSALEGAYQAFVVQEMEFQGQYPTEKALFGILKSKCHRCLYHQLLFYEIFRDRRQIYFPKEWVSWGDYLNLYDKKKETYSKFDIDNILNTEIFSDTERFFLILFLQGHSPVEIAQITGYGNRHVNRTLSSVENRLLNKKEIDVRAAKKWGRIGPYRQKKYR